jgi:hypothetical protein
MITLEDCIDFCGLTKEEVLAIAEHEHLPEIAACALAEYLLNQQHGPEKIRDMIIDDVRTAQARGSREHVRCLLHVLHHFLKTHPDAIPPRRLGSMLALLPPNDGLTCTNGPGAGTTDS